MHNEQAEPVKFIDEGQQHVDVAAAVRQVGARAVRALLVHGLFQRTQRGLSPKQIATALRQLAQVIA